ncbi:MAG: SRPBCC family protein, partial [Myxococcota bacterium]
SRATNRWTVEPIDANRARLTMTVEMETRGVLGALMKPMMRFGMGRLLRENLEEIKHYIETGSPHARKRAANERAPDRRGGRAVSRRA